MSEHATIVVSVAIYKYLSLGAGAFALYLGYCLLRAGHTAAQGEIEAKLGARSFALRKIPAGSFFALIGSAIIGITLWSGFELSSAPTHGWRRDAGYERVIPYERVARGQSPDD